MPSAIPNGATASLPPAGKIDPRGHRFGAGVSAVLLIVAAFTNTPWLVAVVLASIGVSAAFGLRYSIYGVIWRRIVKLARLGPAEPEHEYPPRFAQVLGALHSSCHSRPSPWARRSSAGCSPSRSPRSRASSRSPATALAAACTSCAGGSPIF